MSIRGLAAAALCLFAAAACSQPASSGNSRVATLDSAAPGQPASTGVPERPVLRPDDGREEFDRYVAIFTQCLRKEGATVGSGPKPRMGDDPKSKAAARACDHLYPETWMEREARTNPRYVDRLRETAQCLKEHGHEVTVGGDPVALMYGDNTSANKAYADEQECEKLAFKDDLKKYAGS
ncbi:hypothetical protein COUCH_27625 [Couchioplanes caeruleus]|uniref:hypothetical protein n=1 Tax=Couchioplanes caeruleus TaxID=56438 RepID=UPI0020C0B2B1|nr:hypothetical protein [Couchioplanes caeruleus]UQU62787.1 hypothetical protein COUCH_27625 [Couchioplanes caeruleus]